MERHRTIINTTKALMFALSCLAGIVCCAGGIRAIYREKNAGTFEELSLRNCRHGNYISDVIESYLVAPVENGGNDHP